MLHSIRFAPTVLTLALLPALAPPLWSAQDEGQRSLPEAEDVADVPALDRSAGGNEKKRYVIIGLDEEEKAPAKGYGLLLVLPGGGGGIDFHGFVKRIHKHAVPEGYLTVQLVAPVWTKNQAESLVWPTLKNKVKEAKFTTEEFIFDVVKEVSKDLKIDRRRVFTLTWSSSGPAGYSVSLQKKTPITGSFIAMSVFKKDLLPSLKAAKGKAYYILHSPEDFIPIRMAEEARDALRKSKGNVEYVTYMGGHGWRGNVYGNMRAGIVWLEKASSKH